MKTKFSRFGRSSVSVILAVMMLLSTMLVGTVTTVSAVGANNYKVAAGETLYLDLSANSTTCANFLDGSYIIGNDWFSSLPDNKIISVQLKKEIDFSSYYGRLYNINSNGWKEVKNNPSNTSILPSNGQNMVVVNADNSYYWSTYSGGSTSSTYYVAGDSGLVNGNSWTAAQESDKMSYSDADGYYSITYANKAAGTYQFKITDAKKSWYGYNDFSTYQGTGCTLDCVGNYKNISVTFNQESNVTIKFNIDSNNKKNLIVIAESAVNKYAVTYALGTDSADMGSVSAKSAGADIASGAQVEEGKSVTFKATASEGYEFVGWYSYAACTGDAVSTDAEYTVSNISADTAVYAKFTEKEYTVSHTQGTGYTISGLPTDKVKYNDTVSFTVTPAEGYKIDSVQYNGTAATKGENNTYSFKMPAAAVTVVVEFAKKTVYSVTANDPDGGSVAIDPTNAYEGQKVTVKPTANDGYVLENITAKTNTDQKTVELTKNSDGTYTFSMPADNVVVQANFRTKNTYIVKVSSDNQELGTVSLNGSSDTLETTVTEGDTVTIKANPTGSNKFKSWSIDGTYAIKDSKTTSDAEITLVVNSDITASASFAEAAPFKVAYGSNSDVKTIDMVATKKDGVYVSTAPLANGTNFTIYDVDNNKYALKKAKDTWYINNLDESIGGFENWSAKPTIDEKAGGFRNNTNTTAYVVYNSKDSTVTLQTEPDFGDKAVLYVKTGTSGAGATGKYASKSEAPKLSATSSGTTYKKYSVDYDTSVNIQTTMSDEYLKARYYVAGYSVNGRSYPASAVDASKGIYQANITITEDLAENGVVEVTPIYYNRTIEEDDNYITFYVDAERLVGGWGSTVAIYAYAYEGGTAKYNDGKVINNVNLLGAYPGQPMVKDGQYYVAKIPRYSYKISSNGSLVIDTTSPVAGITLNNYYNDAVHKSLVPIKRNMQTYDFSDFVALANKKDVKTIMFQSKFYNATGDAKRNTKVIYGYDTAISDPTTATTKIDNIESANVNPYEDFTDYYGRATDALGNLLSDAQKADTDNLYIISTGSYNNQSSDYSTKGQWVTIWNVYDHNGNRITYGTPADFLKENTAQYEALNTDAYLGKPVKISYEKGLSYDNGATSRSDGRWYYSRLGQEFTSDVAIEYANDDGTYTADTNTNTANTGFIGETSGATATINNVTTASFSSVTDTAHLNIKVANGWRFDGWYINGNKIGDNYTDISTDILMSNSYHIVARVSKIPTGTLELSHTAYTGTDPAAHTGTGFYYISAVVKKANGSKVEFDETQGVISIDNFAENDELTITLRAKCHGDNTVYALYEGESGGYTEIGPEDKDLRGESEFTYTFTVPAGSLFKNGKLGVNALNYYTDIVKVGGTCDITYKYYDRFSVEGAGNMVSYVVRNVELSTEEIQDNYQPSNSTITKYAPRIDTMYVDTKWNLDDAGKVEKGKSQATVIATQTDKTCDVYYPEKDGEYYTDRMNIKTVAYNTLFKDDNGNFILSAPETDESGKLFTYWEVYRADANGNPTELVTKCYERDFGLRIMADYYIVPVYDGKAPTLTANINAPVLNREIYGDSTSATDKLYVDLLTAFTSTAIPTFKENTTNLRVECGVFVLRNNTTKLSDKDRTTLVTAALAKDDDTTSTILANNYMRSADTETSVVSKLEELAQDSSVKDKSNTLATFDNDQYRITKLIFDNNSLTNKNRIDEVLKFTNNTANQNYIFTAYAFVVIKNSDGTVSEMQISDPQYFNLCYVGNKAL